MNKIIGYRDAKWAIPTALLLTPTIANASDFRGFITVFLGFPTIIFVDLALATLLIEFYLRDKKSRPWLTLPSYGVTLILFLYIAFMNGALLLQGVRSSNGSATLVMLLATLTSFISSCITTLLLFHSSSREAGQGSRRKTTSWSGMILAATTSVLVLFDFRAIIENMHANWSLIALYSLLFGIALVFHCLVIRLPSKGN